MALPLPLPTPTLPAASTPDPLTDTSSTAGKATGIDVTVHLSGGLELLFDHRKSHFLHLTRTTHSSSARTDHHDGDAAFTIRDLLAYLLQYKLRERAELFVVNETVRPGILVLINDCDWEILNGMDAILQAGDHVTFISTLHGG